MKRKFLSVFALSLLCAVSSFAQTALPKPKTILRTPEQANGFLILNGTDFPDVKQWQIVVNEKVWNATTRTWDEQAVYRTTIDGTFWTTLPEEYNTAAHSIQVTGMDAVGAVVTDDIQGMIIGDASYAEYEWICNGKDYVFAIDYYAPVNGYGNIMKLDYPLLIQPEGNYPYFYEWFDIGDWNTVMGPQDPGYHGMNTFDYESNSPNTIDQSIITITLPPNTYYHNRFGDPITGEIRGVKKYLGEYVGLVGNMQSGPLAVDPNGWNLDMAMAVVNDNDENWAEVDCDEGHEIDEGEGSEAEDADPCYEDYYVVTDSWAQSGDGEHTWIIWNFQTIFHVPCDDEQPDTGEGGEDGGFPIGHTSVEWPSNIAHVRLTPIDNPNGAVINVSYEDFYDARGNFIGQPFTLPEGLFMVSYQFTDNSYLSKYFYNPTENTTSFTQSDFVSYTAYPVPITGDSFHLRVAASENVKFNYTLKDARGRTLFSDDFELEKGTEINKEIAPDNGVPTGVLFNTLTFADGSQINFQTMK